MLAENTHTTVKGSNLGVTVIQSTCSVIVRARVVLKRTVVGDSD